MRTERKSELKKVDLVLYRSLSQLERRLLGIVALTPDDLPRALLADFAVRKLKVPMRECQPSLVGLGARGFLSIGKRSHYEKERVALASRFSAEALREMAEDVLAADALFPDRELVKVEFAREIAAGSSLLAHLAAGRPVPEDRARQERGQVDHPDVACRAVAERWMALSDELPLLPDAPYDGFADYVVAAWLNLAFLKGVDVRQVLLDVRRRLENGEKVGDSLLVNFAALCAWTGDRDGIAALDARETEPMADVAELVLAGKLKEADKLARAIQRENCAPGDFDYESMDLVPLRVLLVALTMAVRPNKTRPAQLMERRWWQDGCGDAERYSKTVAATLRSWSESWRSVFEGEGALLAHAKLAPASPLTGTLILAWDWHQLAAGRAALRKRAAELVPMARQCAERGYVNVAGLLLSLLTGAYEEEKVKDVVASVDAGGTWLLPRVAPEPEWQGFVRGLEGFLDKRERGEARAAKNGDSSRSLFWVVRFGRYQAAQMDRHHLASLESLSLRCRPAGGREDGSDDESLSLASISTKSVKALLAEREDDNLLAKTVLADQNVYYSGGTQVEIIELLCRMTNLLTPVYVQRKGRWGELFEEESGLVPIRFEKRPCRLSLTTLADGGIEVRLPAWLGDGSCGRGGYVLQRVEEGVCAYIPITDEMRKLSELFGRYAADGKVVLPGSAMGMAAPVVERLASVVPVEEPSADDVAKLRHVKAEATLVVRLDFAEGVLTVKAVVRPLKDSPQIVLSPGTGATEKLIAGPLGSYVLDRDLAAEQSAFARVRGALAEAEDWFDGQDAWTVDDIAAAIAALGALKALEPPVELEWLKDRRLDVRSMATSGVALESFRTADEWFDVKGTFTLDDGRVMSVVQMLEAMRARPRGGYVKLSDGAYLTLTKAMASELDALAAVSRRKGDGVEVSRAAVPMLDGVFGKGRADGALALPAALAQSADEIRRVFARRPAVPPTLQAELRPYQEDGYRWLARLASCGLGACLADDMGLGKTLQVIALLLARADDGASLVVAPSSVCGNWRREIRRFAPTLEPVLALETPGCVADAGARSVVVVSYGYILFHEDAFAGRAWNGIVLDEAQAIKNDLSKRARAVKRLKGRFRVAATGTPVENRLGELWSLFDFLNPGLLGTATSFSARFTSDGRATPALKRTVKPLVLRRLKGDVLDDLPEKTEVTIPVTLGKDERSAYEGCRLHALASLAADAEEKGEQNRISILAELTRLRRFCCHPSLVLGESSGVASAKMEALVDLLEGLRAGGHRALVFSQFVDYLAIVRKVVESHGWSCQYLDGSTPTLERERLVAAFQGGEGDFFLISLKAGGTGLNLTAANYVILLDPWWNPAVENQAADRAHRIGQTQPVTIYRLVAEDTVEERVIELHKQKTAMSADLLEGTSDAKFSPADLMKLFGPS